MTNEDAIKRLKEVQAEFNENWVDYGGINEAFKKAYQALEEKPQITIFCENADEKTVEELKAEMQKAKLAVFEESPQGDIRWTDKLSVKSNGDIIDFEGRVVGHINLEDVKGDAENDL